MMLFVIFCCSDAVSLSEVLTTTVPTTMCKSLEKTLPLKTPRCKVTERAIDSFASRSVKIWN